MNPITKNKKTLLEFLNSHAGFISDLGTPTQRSVFLAQRKSGLALLQKRSIPRIHIHNRVSMNNEARFQKR